jgi:hypothetical protein
MSATNPIFANAVRRTRQHHAIEHATIHLLAARNPHRRFAGLSDPWGFTLYADVPQEEVRGAAADALLHLQAGEQELAIHPNCGTNLTTSIMLVTLSTLLATTRQRGFLDRLTVLLALITGTMLLAQPLGFQMQRYTTLADVSDRRLVSIEPITRGKQQAYRILLA